MKKSTIILLISLVLIGLFLGEINEITGESIWSRLRRIRKVPEIIQEETSLGPNEYFFDVGDTQKIEGKKVKLLNVGSGGAVIVEVNGKIQTIPSAETRNIEGLTIKISETYYASIKSERAATLKIVKATEEMLNKYFFDVNDIKTINNKKITLLNVGSGGAVVVGVDGIVDTISATEKTKVINGLEITIYKTYYASIKSERAAELIIKVAEKIAPIPVEPIQEEPSPTPSTTQTLFTPTNLFDAFNARCKWYKTSASATGVIPDNFCSKKGNLYICIDSLGAGYLPNSGPIEGIKLFNCNEKVIGLEELYIKCCDGRPFST